MDFKLTWKQYIYKKIEHIRLKRRNIYCLTSKYSKLSPENKLLLYKTISKPIWTYGIQLWGMAAKSHIRKLESLQAIILRTVVTAPWYIRNDEIRKDLNIVLWVSDEIGRLCPIIIKIDSINIPALLQKNYTHSTNLEDYVGNILLIYYVVYEHH